MNPKQIQPLQHSDPRTDTFTAVQELTTRLSILRNKLEHIDSRVNGSGPCNPQCDVSPIPTNLRDKIGNLFVIVSDMEFAIARLSDGLGGEAPLPMQDVTNAVSMQQKGWRG